jgi:hypothetical protein
LISDDPFVMQPPQDIRQQIDQDVDANRIASHLIELPRCIHDQQVQVAELRKAVDTAKGELLNEEALLAAEINGEINPQTGKPQYSNDAARKAELIVRQRSSPSYQSCVAALQAATSAMALAEAQLAMLTNEFSAYSRVAELMANRLRLFAN